MGVVQGIHGSKGGYMGVVQGIHGSSTGNTWE